MRYVSHGGKCCGMMHIHGFNWYDFEDHARALNGLNDAINRALERRYYFNRAYYNTYYGDLSPAEREKQRLKDRADWNCLIEVILIDEQLEDGWAAVLEERGFKLVTRFYNDNSNNYCNVFHLQTASKEEK